MAAARTEQLLLKLTAPVSTNKNRAKQTNYIQNKIAHTQNAKKKNHDETINTLTNKAKTFSTQQRDSASIVKINSTMLDPDLDEYLTEYRLQAPAEPISHYEGNSLKVNSSLFCSFNRLQLID